MAYIGDFYSNTIEQHTDEWYKIKEELLGANDCVSLLGHGFNTPLDIIKQKITKTRPDLSDNSSVQKGIRLELAARNFLSKILDINIMDTGLKYHNKYDWLTASPDGIYKSVDYDNDYILVELN